MPKKRVKLIPKDRRQRILEAAVKVFSEKGAPFARLSEVAKAAGVPAPLIHYYYASVEDLHFDVIQYAVQELAKISVTNIDSDLNPVQSMKAYIRSPFEWVVQDPQLASVLTYFYYLASCQPRFKQLNDQIRARGRERIEMMIHRGREQGAFRLSANKSTQVAAYEIQAIITGFSVQYFTETSQLKLDEYVDRACEHIFKLLGCAE